MRRVQRQDSTPYNSLGCQDLQELLYDRRRFARRALGRYVHQDVLRPLALPLGVLAPRRGESDRRPDPAGAGAGAAGAGDHRPWESACRLGVPGAGEEGGRSSRSSGWRRTWRRATGGRARARHPAPSLTTISCCWRGTRRATGTWSSSRRSRSPRASTPSRGSTGRCSPSTTRGSSSRRRAWRAKSRRT